MKNRGVQDVLIACVESLSGFSEAISAVFPDTEIQKCVIHQIRNSTSFVSYKDIKPLMSDLKRVYTAPGEEIALSELDQLTLPGVKNIPKSRCPGISTGLNYRPVSSITKMLDS